MNGHDSGPRALGAYRQALRSRHFRLLWLAAVVSRAGDAINFVALPLLTLAITGSAAAVAGLVLVEGAALVVGGTAAQLVVDHVEPRRLLVAVDLGRAAAAAVLAAVPSYPVALAVAAALGLGTSWFSPTSSALIPRLVDRGSLAAANSLQWTAGVALQLVAAPAGGLLFLVSPRVPFGINAVSFAASAAILVGLPRRAALVARAGSWRALPSSLRAVREVPGLGALIAMQALAALAAGATSALLVVLAERAYGLDGAGYGIWLSAAGAGALVGPLAVPLLTRLLPRRGVAVAYVVRGAGDIGLGLIGNGFAGGALLFVYGLNTSSGSVAFQTLVQQAAPSHVRGRAFALLDVTWQAGRLVSVAVGGAIAGMTGVRPVFVAGGALLIGAGAVGLVTIRGAAGEVRH